MKRGFQIFWEQRRDYGHIERGFRKGSIETWERLSSIFGVSIQELRKKSRKPIK